jgi:hypothetical protein
MPLGPKAEKRPADEIGNAAHVMRIADGSVGFVVEYCDAAYGTTLWWRERE